MNRYKNEFRQTLSFCAFLLITLLVSGCSPKMALPADYYQRKGKIGVILEEMPRFDQYPASAINQYAQIANLAAAVERNIKENNQRSRNNERIVDNVSVEFQLLLAQLLQVRGRDAIVILQPFNRNELNKIDEGYGYDVKELAVKNGLSELLIIKVNQYGLWKQPEYEVNTYINMTATLVDATNNQVMWKTTFNPKDVAVNIPGEWVGIPNLPQYLKSLVTACSISAETIVLKMDQSGPTLPETQDGVGSVR